MAKCDCRIVGDLDIGIDGVFSINVSANTQVSKTMDGDIVIGPKEKIISISAYPFLPGESDKTGCAVKISSQFKWTKVYSCDDDIYYYVYQKIGNISSLGEPPDIITFDALVDQGVGYNASASSGPYSYYMGDEVSSAFSMHYTGLPIEFNSANQDDMVMKLGNIADRAFLQSFTYTGGLGANIPIVTYRFEAGPAEILDDQVVQCDSISISYDVHGVLTLSMTVYSNSTILDIESLPRIFGGIICRVTGASVDMSPVPFSDSYKYNVSLTGIGE
jgi:hypothetical protein